MDFLGYTPYLCISILGEKDETLIENRFNYLIFSIMIKISMTPREVLNELKTVDDYVQERMYGLTCKNSKKMKSKFVKHNEIMSKSTYVVPGISDTVVVYAVKENQTLKGKACASMYLAYYLKTQYGTYIIPCIDFISNRVIRYVEFSSHSIERMRERLGKDFDTFFREDYIKKNTGLFHPVKYEFNGKENEYVAHVGEAFIILAIDSSGLMHIVKTLLSVEDLYSNQLKLKLDSKMIGESVMEEYYNYKVLLGESCYKGLKKSGMIKEVA